ncbi:Cell death-related nuclease [Trichinella spiralis]|uniref:Cell death-related nuclease n=1 Tax=Trichinella spiralis TaxID=6334 RepID=A0ABR3KB31_TRISP
MWVIEFTVDYNKQNNGREESETSEYANGHLLICLTIAESQIEPIAVALFVASPFIHYNDVPDAEVRTRPTLKKLLNGETPIHPPFSSKQAIKTQAGDPVSVQIFSKSGRSKYEIYQKIISRQLKKTIKLTSLMRFHKNMNQLLQFACN